MTANNEPPAQPESARKPDPNADPIQNAIGIPFGFEIKIEFEFEAPKKLALFLCPK